MKRYISKYDEKYYTHMLKLINSIGDETLEYNWLITDIEAYPIDKNINDKINNEYLLLSNNELLNILKKEDFQWINATFSAIPKQKQKKDIFQYSLPTTAKATLRYNEKPIIQHPLAEIEINCIDSSFFAILSKNDHQLDNLKQTFPKLLESSDSPEDYFTSQQNRIDAPTFEFSYYKFNSHFPKRKISNIFKKQNNTIYHKDDLYIYMDYFDDFIQKFPYFDNITLKKGKTKKSNYYSPDNYYDKKQTEYILNQLKKEIPNNNKAIIKFLEKAITEHDGFYIHGI